MTCNAQLPGPVARRQVRLEKTAEDFLGAAVDSMGLTGRGFDRALKVARTVADLEDAEVVDASHMAEALCYRDGFGGEGLADAV